MELQMHAYALPTKPGADVDVALDNAELFFLWDPRPDLHQWMERLYRRKGGRFRNCVGGNLVLTWRDLDRLERYVYVCGLIKDVFPHLAPATCAMRADDLRFVARARNVRAGGWTVVYAAEWQSSRAATSFHAAAR